jgi:hypothetical protein
MPREVIADFDKCRSRLVAIIYTLAFTIPCSCFHSLELFHFCQAIANYYRRVPSPKYAKYPNQTHAILLRQPTPLRALPQKAALLAIAIGMLTSLDLTSRVPVFACAIAFLARMVLACMVLMRMWLRLDVNQEVVPILPNRMDQAIISVWPLALLLTAILQIVLCKVLLGDVLV